MKLSLLLMTIATLLLASCTPSSEEVPTLPQDENQGEETTQDTELENDTMTDGPIQVTPIAHATAVLTWDDTVIYSDPTGGTEAFAGQPDADIVFVTDVHGDHLSVETLEAVVDSETVLIVPQAVADELPEDIDADVVIMVNGEKIDRLGFSIEAIPMYNLPESDDSRHIKGRGNGYVFEKDGTRVYFSGDTADIDEMRNLADIDIAFVCMNLPYTMDVDTAADAVLDFAPAKVYPYHYRGQDGLSDVDRFAQLVNEENSDIQVVLLDWYPAEQ